MERHEERKHETSDLKALKIIRKRGKMKKWSERVGGNKLLIENCETRTKTNSNWLWRLKTMKRRDASWEAISISPKAAGTSLP